MRNKLLVGCQTMITGTSKTTLSVARMALLAGVSAAALVAAGAASAQSLPDLGATGFTKGTAAIAALPVPTGIDTNPYILETLTGVSVANTTGLDSAGVLKTKTWAETVGTATTYNITTQNRTDLTNQTVAGTYQLGSYLVKGNNLLASGAIGAGVCGATDNCHWVTPGDSDVNNTYRWVAATYGEEARLANVTAPNGNPNNQYITGAYHTGDLIVRTDTGALVNSATCTNTVACKFVSAGALDTVGAAAGGVNATAGSYQNVPDVGVPSALGARTTTYDGGVTYSNGAGQSTAIGPDGITSKGALWVNTNGLAGAANRTTIINDGTFISISGTALQGGATVIEGGKAFIVGGPANSNFGGNINTLPINTAALNVSGGAVVSNGLQVNDGLRVTGPNQGLNAQTVSMGGNQVHDVAAPTLGTDAANKAYVDKGVNKAYEGTALALAISQPVFLPGQSFALRAGWGGFESENAFGVSAAGVIARDTFGHGSTVALDGGVGVGTHYNSVAGKAGVTIGFGGGYAPLK
jgi:trimeric autotransporter adhesin